ncbi:putative GroES-like superfamily, polyketide synthase, enoylreductase domain-containing protein [Septoria linicola]|nr:putative GroES-like superfamily, polyketide synthase, enoylreductase domain-containing protein [Septoria linicola]
MRQAQISTWGGKPKLLEVHDLPPPEPDEVRIKIEATGVHRVVRSRATGKHYTSGKLPHIPGIDGVGTTDDGRRVYFCDFTTGSISEYINVPICSVYPVPDGVDARQIAGAINPAMSSWMAFKERTSNLPKDFTVLILGATSASGRVAIPLARALGAKQVIGAARSRAALDTLGLDRTIVVASEAEQTDFSNLDDVDVVLDYVYGPLAVHLFKSLMTPKPVQYVHIGALSNTEISLPGEVLRSKDITIRGSGPGAWKMSSFAQTLPDLLAAMSSIPEQPVKVAKFEDVEREWHYSGPDRLVFVP